MQRRRADVSLGLCVLGDASCPARNLQFEYAHFFPASAFVSYIERFPSQHLQTSQEVCSSFPFFGAHLDHFLWTPDLSVLGSALSASHAKTRLHLLSSEDMQKTLE